MNKRVHLLLFGCFILTLIWSVINPSDYFTWFLDVLPALIGVGVLILTYRKFTLTTLTYFLIYIHTVILFIGGHYTYAEVPLFNWLRDTYDLSRNHYDRLGHLAQGFIPAIIIREVLIRKSIVLKKRWLPFIIVSVCLAISASYELIEWRVSVATGSAGDAFLGTQGDVWDTQSDMALALTGAILALLTISKIHDAAIRKITETASR